jgi:hypothetical protein
MSDTYDIREKLIQIALQDMGKVEDTHNQADWIKKYWPMTSYPDGYSNEEPYCAAGQVWFVHQWLQLPEVQAAFNKSAGWLEDWRPKSAAVFDWNDWAEGAEEVELIGSYDTLHCGDMAIFDCSHIAVVWTDRGNNLITLECNTGPMGERDGDGAYIKIRSRDEMRNFIRLLQ